MKLIFYTYDYDTFNHVHTFIDGPAFIKELFFIMR